MQHISTAIDKWLLNKLISYKAQFAQASKTIPLERGVEWSQLRDTLSFLEAELIKRGISYPEIS